MDSSTNETSSTAVDQQQKQQQQQQQHEEELTPKIVSAISKLAKVPEDHFEIETQAIAGVGENAYGLVLQVHLKPKAVTSSAFRGSRCILKIAPKNSARRSHMQVADYYAREVYMYDVVFRAYRDLMTETTNASVELDLMPKMLDYSLDDGAEFIIFEDLTQSNYIVGRRTQLPDYDMASMALNTLGKFHALSFALQAKNPEVFDVLIAQLQPDNLFTPDIEPLSIEFGKSYVRRAHNMIQADLPEGHDLASHLETLQNVEHDFKDICLRCVDGKKCAPYAAICHGDFWNNNILNKYDHNKRVTSTKLIDFQMSRYASPILDLVHYLFVCTARDLRESRFQHLLHDVYYVALSQQLQLFKLDVVAIYPHEVFEHQLRNYGVYGLCMAAFSLPFFVADTTQLPDLDKVSEAIKDIGASNDTTTTQTEADTSDKELNESRIKLIEEDFNLLSARTALVFKSRMAGIVADIVKYDIRTDFQNLALNSFQKNK